MRCFGAVVLVLLLVQTTAAQERGSITGTVTMARGGRPVGGVNVVVVGTLYGATTNVAGEFMIQALPSGAYTLQVMALDFRPVRAEVTVQPGQTAEVRFRLRPEQADLEEEAAERPVPWPREMLDRPHLQAHFVTDTGQWVRTATGTGAGRQASLHFIPNVRGLDESSLGVYVDGARLFAASPLWADAPPGHVPPGAVDAIEVVPGPYALTWGPGSLSAVRVATRGENLPAGWLNGSVQLGVSSNLGAREALGTLTGSDGTLGYWLMGSYRTGEDYDDGDDDVVQADFQAADVRGRVGYTFGPSARLTATAGYRDARDVVYPAIPFDARSLDATHGTIRYEKAWTVGLVRAFDVLAYGQRSRHRMTDRSRDLFDRAASDLDADLDAFGGRLAAQLAPSGRSFTLDVGADLYHVAREATWSSVASEEPVAVWDDARETNLGFFAGATRAAGRLEATGSVRLDLARLAVEVPSERLDLNVDLDADEALASAAVAAAVQATPAWRVGTGLGTGARLPDIREQAGLPFLTLPILPNPSLEPERILQADAWVEGERGRIRLRTAAFARRVIDAVTLTRADVAGVPEPLVSLIFRNENVVYFGGEAAVDYRLFGEFAVLHLGGQWLHGENTERDEPAFGVMPPNLDAGLRLTAPADLFFLETVVHAVAAHERVAVARGELETDGYVTADLRFGLRLPGRAALLLGLDNLTNRSYSYPLNAARPFQEPVAEPGRVFFARLSLYF